MARLSSLGVQFSNFSYALYLELKIIKFLQQYIKMPGLHQQVDVLIWWSSVEGLSTKLRCLQVTLYFQQYMGIWFGNDDNNDVSDVYMLSS